MVLPGHGTACLLEQLGSAVSATQVVDDLVVQTDHGELELGYHPVLFVSGIPDDRRTVWRAGKVGLLLGRCAWRVGTGQQLDAGERAGAAMVEIG